MLRTALLIVALLVPAVSLAAQENEPAAVVEPVAAARIDAMKAGESVDIGGRRVTVKQIDILPLVENEYSKRFTFDSYENPKLKLLREQEKLDEVVAAGKDEFDRQVLLLDWTYRRFKKFGRPTSEARGALDVVKAIDEGNTFFCSHYGDVMVSAAASLGWVNRPMSLRIGNRITGSGGGGSTEHTITEIWSNQYRKWVMFDPTYALYVEKDGVPLSAWEIRSEWFGNEGADLKFVMGAERKKYTRKDMPILRAKHAGFGDLSLDTRTMDKYAFLGYIPNTNLMDAGMDWGKMFIVRDALTEGVSWHNRDNPKNPGVDAYFPINQAALTITAAGAAEAEAAEGVTLAVSAATMSPNFLTFRYRYDEGEWTEGKVTGWKLHAGSNTLEVQAVNRFGVGGPVSKVALEVKGGE